MNEDFGSPQEPQVTAPVPKLGPGEGLKKFLASGALDALLSPQGAQAVPEEPQEDNAQLMNFLRLMGGPSA